MRELSVEEVRTVQLDILKAVDKWCRENNVNYYLIAGTLLGAIRHKGYIPWDDDIDICMLRTDFEKFLHNFNENRDDGYKVLHSCVDKQFPYEYAKVVDTRTKLVENTDVKYDIGVNIDLFIFDNIDDLKHTGKISSKIRIPALIIEWKNMSYSKDRTLIKRAAFRIIKGIADSVSMYWCTKRIDEAAKTYKAYEDSQLLISGSTRWFNGTQIYRREWFADCADVEFEGCLFKAPKNYDEVLKVLYGDYMQLPPVEQQITHHDFKAYER